MRELPVATTLAGVNMHLNGGTTETGIREMHWHKESEWGYVLNGSVRLTAMDERGRNFISDVGEGDLWYFPAGRPHSIQAHGDGAEFLLVFDDGAFSENSTFLLTDWLAHTSRSVIAKNFGIAEEALADLPAKEKYIFPAPVPLIVTEETIVTGAGFVPDPFSFALSKMPAKALRGGNVKIADSTNFKISKTIASALVEIEPGGLRELHWHPNNDEWQYWIEGEGRMTVFASGGKARTFDYRAGDVGYVPFAMGHYIENTGDKPLRFLEMFKSDKFEDISLNQWLALTPPRIVKAHLNLGDDFISHLSEEKQIVVPK